MKDQLRQQIAVEKSIGLDVSLEIIIFTQRQRKETAGNTCPWEKKNPVV